MDNVTPRRARAVSLQQASEDSPTLAALLARAREGQLRLERIRPLLPEGMLQSIQSGPLEDDIWCLIVGNSAQAAKLRQSTPALLEHLRLAGWELSGIRIKVAGRR